MIYVLFQLLLIHCKSDNLPPEPGIDLSFNYPEDNILPNDFNIDWALKTSGQINGCNKPALVQVGNETSLAPKEWQVFVDCFLGSSPYKTEGLHSLKINSSYRPYKKDKDQVHYIGKYWDIGYLNEQLINNGAGGGPPRLPTVAEPDIYKRFFQAHQRTSGKKQFLGSWRQNSKGANFNWGDPAGDSTDPKHYNHIHLGYI